MKPPFLFLSIILTNSVIVHCQTSDCCSHNLKSCITWCGTTPEACHSCNGQSGEFAWIEGERTGCTGRWQGCNPQNSECCYGLICSDYGHDAWYECQYFGGDAYDPGMTTTDSSTPSSFPTRIPSEQPNTPSFPPTSKSTRSAFPTVSPTLQPSAFPTITIHPTSSSLLAFPSAVGFGRYATGGRYGNVFKVTNLNDSGNGSFRKAVEETAGPRIIVFDVSGYINLLNPVNVIFGDLTIAGQTSPHGITIAGFRLKIKASNVIVRGMRFRPGDAFGTNSCGNRDGFGIGTNSYISDIIFDHCSATWALDENGSSWYASTRTTISNCLFGEGIYGKCGTASFGYLVGTDGGNPTPNQITFFQNAFINNANRNPQIKDGANEIEVINNFAYGWRSAALGVAGVGTSVNVINNYNKHGEESAHTGYREAYYLQGSDHSIFLEGNVDNCHRPDATQGSEDEVGHKQGGGPVDPTNIVANPAFVGTGIQPIPAGDVWQTISNNTGAIHPHRDSIDTAIIDSVSDANNIPASGNCQGKDLGSGSLISTAGSYIGTYQNNPTDGVLVDDDGDGIPDSIEELWCLNKSDAGDAQQVNSHSSYTWIEEYINSFYTGNPATTNCA